MHNLFDLLRRTCWLTGVMTAAAMGQTPTFSLELVEVNSIPLCGGGVSKMTVAPNDVLVAKVFLRDWSSNGEELRGYQAELNHGGFTSGTTGSIKPVGYQTTTVQGRQNLKNVLIDLTDPEYAHYGDQAIAFADSDHASPGYRWISVLFRNGGPVSPQDGTKFYCGTLKLLVSEDAEGTFTLELSPGIDASTLRTPSADLIEPLELEPLTLVVTSGERPVWISSSSPPHGSVDAREPSSKSGQRHGSWRNLELAFSATPGPLRSADFTVEDGTTAPPRIASVEASGKKVKLSFDRPITRGAWTTVSHTASGTRARIGHFPGDVNSDGHADPRDLRLLVDGLNRVVTLPTYRTDLDDSGAFGAGDVLQFITVLNRG